MICIIHVTIQKEHITHGLLIQQNSTVGQPVGFFVWLPSCVFGDEAVASGESPEVATRSTGPGNDHTMRWFVI